MTLSQLIKLNDRQPRASDLRAIRGCAPKRRTLSLLVLGLALIPLAGCKEEKAAAPAAPPRPVVVLTVSESDKARERLIGGVVQAANRADLAFRIAGRIIELTAEIGDQVQKGDVLARLDPTIPSLRRQQAIAAVSRTEATLVERRRRLEVQRKLQTSGNTTLQAVRAAELEVATSEAELRDARAALALAEREVADSTLTAPHDGIVAAREVEQNSEVGAGQVVLRIDGVGALEVASNLPGNLVDQVQAGTKVSVSVSSVSRPLDGVVSRIGGRGETGLTFPVIVSLPPEARVAGVRPGMVADLAFASGNTSEMIIVPLTAIVPEGEQSQGHVFVLGQDGTSVIRRTVTIGALDSDGVHVRRGLQPGERIVAVGAAFLSDGASVRPLPAR